jgi:hypothetical protein
VDRVVVAGGTPVAGGSRLAGAADYVLLSTDDVGAGPATVEPVERMARSQGVAAVADVETRAGALLRVAVADLSSDRSRICTYGVVVEAGVALWQGHRRLPAEPRLVGMKKVHRALSTYSASPSCNSLATSPGWWPLR